MSSTTTRHGLRLLSLDGGGVRGLSLLLILRRLMEEVDFDDPPKPCDYFDMIGGTSTGELIAIMLGRLRMTIDQCIKTYIALSDRVFEKTSHRVSTWSNPGQLQGRFDTAELERAIRRTIIEAGFEENQLLYEKGGNPCKVFVCAMSKETKDPICMTSYRIKHSRYDLLRSLEIWQACRATSAATTFFDPITVDTGDAHETFVDGATGANNPIQVLWNEAQELWGSPLTDRIQCLVSIGTGVPKLRPFETGIFKIGNTLTDIATETENTAEKFQRDKAELSGNRYFRFNVDQGLEDIGLERSSKKDDITAVTQRYLRKDNIVRDIEKFALAVPGSGSKYNLDFSYEHIPDVHRRVDRPTEIAILKDTLLPRYSGDRQVRRSVFLLHGMGGIGKTFIATEFVRQYRACFTAILWLDGSSRQSLEESFAGYARLIAGIAETSQSAPQFAQSRMPLVNSVRDWLSINDNKRWLLVFDNVDRAWSQTTTDPQAYDVRQFFPSADHGAILITSRLRDNKMADADHEVRKVSPVIERKIFKLWCKRDIAETDADLLRSRLDGLPLALIQAACYIEECGTNVSIADYVRLYSAEWAEIASNLPSDYSSRSIYTTWEISFKAIEHEMPEVANLLRLWAFLYREHMTYDLLHKIFRCESARELLVVQWLESICPREITFNNAMRLLRRYSMVQESEGISGTKLSGYGIHPVVHEWMASRQDETSRVRYMLLANFGIACVMFPSMELGGLTSLEDEVALAFHVFHCAKGNMAALLNTRPTHDSSVRLCNGVWEQPSAGTRLGKADLTDAVHGLAILLKIYREPVLEIRLLDWVAQNRREMYGPQHPLTAHSMLEYASSVRASPATERIFHPRAESEAAAMAIYTSHICKLELLCDEATLEDSVIQSLLWPRLATELLRSLAAHLLGMMLSFINGEREHNNPDETFMLCIQILGKALVVERYGPDELYWDSTMMIALAIGTSYQLWKKQGLFEFDASYAALHEKLSDALGETMRIPPVLEILDYLFPKGLNDIDLKDLTRTVHQARFLNDLADKRSAWRQAPTMFDSLTIELKGENNSPLQGISSIVANLKRLVFSDSALP